MKRLAMAAAAAVLALVGALAVFAAESGKEQPKAKPATPVKGAKPVEYGPGKLVCWAANRRINESSGVAASRTTPGVFWTHNDSGDGPNLYAFDLKGNSLGTHRIMGRARDWEDICTFKTGGKGYVVAADTGDNRKFRRDYRIYVCEEPTFKADGKGEPLKVVGQAKTVESFGFTYSDGKSHDGESLAAAPDGRTLYIVTRNRRGRKCKAFKIERYTKKTGTKLKARIIAKEIAVLQHLNVSALDISPDGLRMIVHTYGDGYEYARKPKETWKEALKRKARRIAFPAKSPRVKGEGCTYGFDGVTLYLTSENGRGCPLFVVPVKKK
jgi:hypothetical protein